MFGLFLIFWGLLVLLSLVSFNQNDPSINHAVSNPAVIRNNAGLFGAYLSGLLVDIFGLASFVWPLVFLAWGAGCVSTWFTMPWWRWFGFTLLAACLISLGAAWNLGIGDVRGGGMLGLSLYTVFTTMFSPVGSTLIWLFLLFISLELAFGIAWLSLIRKAGAFLKEQLSGTPFSIDDLPERLSKVSMPKVSLPKMTLSRKDKQEESAADVIALFDIHEEEEKPEPKREAPLSMDPPLSATPPPAAPRTPADAEPLKLWEPPSEQDMFAFQPEEPSAPPQQVAATALLSGENPLLALTVPEPAPVRPAAPEADTFRLEPETPPAAAPQPRITQPIETPVRPDAAQPVPTPLQQVPAAGTAPLTAPQAAPSGTPLTASVQPAAQPQPAPAAQTRIDAPVGAVPPAKPVPHKRKLPMPPLDILQQPQQSDSLPSREVLEEQSAGLMNCLAEFNIQGELVRVTPGPVITLFEIRPAPGVRVGRFTSPAASRRKPSAFRPPCPAATP